MITAGDFRNGVTFEMEGKVYQVIEFQHVKPGKGAAFVRTKYKDVVSGATREASFNPTAKFETVQVERRELRYKNNRTAKDNYEKHGYVGDDDKRGRRRIRFGRRL